MKQLTRQSTRAAALLRTGGLLSVVFGVFTFGQLAPAAAHDGSNTSTYGITTAWDYFAPSGSSDEASNGKKVHLSSPRHSSSGNRGELWSPGYQENVNGRSFNWRAANGNYLGTDYAPTNKTRNLHSRGYLVWVGPNPKDNGYLTNRTHAQDWGADVTIITHTNAGAPTNPYNLVMWDSTADRVLAEKMSQRLGPGVPGGDNVGSDNAYFGENLPELKGNATYGDAYVELQFHDVRPMQTWLANQSYTAAWRYGYGVDDHLGYP